MNKLERIKQYLKDPLLYEVYTTKMGYLSELIDDEDLLALYLDTEKPLTKLKEALEYWYTKEVTLREALECIDEETRSKLHHMAFRESYQDVGLWVLLDVIRKIQGDDSFLSVYVKYRKSLDLPSNVTSIMNLTYNQAKSNLTKMLQISWLQKQTDILKKELV